MYALIDFIDQCTDKLSTSDPDVLSLSVLTAIRNNINKEDGLSVFLDESRVLELVSSEISNGVGAHIQTLKRASKFAILDSLHSVIPCGLFIVTSIVEVGLF